MTAHLKGVGQAMPDKNKTTNPKRNDYAKQKTKKTIKTMAKE